MRIFAASWFIPILAVSIPALAADADVTVLDGATLLPITAEPIPNGRLIIQDGKIVGIGSPEDLQIPQAASVIDMSGKVIMPGLVDTHSHLGVAGDHAEYTAPVTPEVRILDSFWPADPRIKVARAGGVTTANVMPGSGNIIGGQTIYIKLRGDTVEEMLHGDSIGGLKMASGENPKGSGGAGDKSPVTRMGTAAAARQKFYDAMAYRNKKTAAAKSRKAKAPDMDLGLEALLEVLDGKRVVHHHTHRSDDIMTVLRLRDEFGYRLVIQHGLESYKLAQELATRDDIFISYAVLDSPGGKHEAFDVRLDGAAGLEQVGLEIALHSDDWIIDSRFLLRSAGLAVRGGMSREAALRALTINPARMLDLGEKIGSLEPGKDADLVVLDGDPLSVYTHVQQTWIDGAKYYDRSRRSDRVYATGGFNVVDRYPFPGEQQ